ncbi:MAG: NAD(+) synthase [Bacteroidales bacterium]|nr:NAD(+) synthase [Bacteroidales bacterium]
MSTPAFHKDILKIDDVEKLVEKITDRLRKDVTGKLRRYGGVIGISGGIDSSVTMALAVRALGAENILGVMMPEKDSSPDSRELANNLANQFKVQTIVEDITGALDGYKCYERRDQAVKDIIPEYDPSSHKMKIGIKQSNPGSKLPPVFHLTVVKPDGSEIIKRLPTKQMRTIIAASNFKQRARMSFLYYHAERMHYAVIGTPNKHEVEQGFFVKFGDGGSDVFPIGKLYKTQVYQVAEYLDIPREIIERVPTTDTYSAEQTQEEFFYQFPFEQLDLLWYGYENNHNPAEVGKVLDMTGEVISMIYRNFERKSDTTSYLRMQAINDYDFI